MKTYYVYVIRCGLGKIYIGQTEDLKLRIKEHNDGRSQATKFAGDWRLVYFEKFNSRRMAMKRETFFKSGDGRKILKSKVDHPELRGVAQLGLERLLGVQEIVGSNPTAPIFKSDGHYVKA